MDAVCLAWRYACIAVRVFARRFEADYVLTRAVRTSDGADVTAGAIAALASDDRDWFRLNSVVIEYTYKGLGPYKYVAEPPDGNSAVFPPTEPSGGMVPPEVQVISAERSTSEGGEPEDVTDELAAFAGPDGTFHGLRVGDDGGRWGDASWRDFDAEGLIGTGDYTLVLANGESVCIETTIKEEEDL